MITLKELEIGKTARISSVGGEGALRQHFLDMVSTHCPLFSIPIFLALPLQCQKKILTSKR